VRLAADRSDEIAAWKNWAKNWNNEWPKGAREMKKIYIHI